MSAAVERGKKGDNFLLTMGACSTSTEDVTHIKSQIETLLESDNTEDKATICKHDVHKEDAPSSFAPEGFSAEQEYIPVDDLNSTHRQRSSWDAIDWPVTTDIACWWCCEPFDTLPLKIPMRVDPRTKRLTRMFGNFCSFSCCKAYALDSKAMGFSVGSNILLLYQRLMGHTPKNGIKVAPPRQALVRFGGPLRINEFRSSCMSPENINPSPDLVIFLRHKTIVSPSEYIFNENGFEDDEQSYANRAHSMAHMGKRKHMATPARMKQASESRKKLGRQPSTKPGSLEHTMGLKIHDCN